MKKTEPATKRIFKFISSVPFFWGIVGLLGVQAAWIALSGRYPMAFDEDFHLGVMRLYANHPNPFWSGAVVGGDAFGAVARDPSYLYHYLMSFPYKFISEFISNLQAQVLLLRGVNIAFFAAGLVIYRKLLLKTGASKAIVHLCLLLFVLIPVTSLLAAQINYDNAFIPLTGLVLLLTLNFCAKTTKKSIDLRALLVLVALCLFTGVIKYAFLPVAIVILVYVSIVLWNRFDSLVQFKEAFLQGWNKSNKLVLAALTATILLVGGLFAERYGVNLVRYHKPVADCGQVLTYDQCKHYGPWIRDYNLKANRSTKSTSLVSFEYEWVRGMWTRSFFALAGPDIGYQTRGPLIVPGLSALVFAVVGSIAFVWKAKVIWRKYYKPALWLMLSVSVGYVGVLWLENYRMYNSTGVAVAINGRYLLPIVPFAILFVALAANEITKRQPKLQLVIASLAVVCFAWGGGALTYVLRSNDNWYWQNIQFVKSTNQAIQQTIGPATPGNYRSSQYLR